MRDFCAQALAWPQICVVFEDICLAELCPRTSALRAFVLPRDEINQTKDGVVTMATVSVCLSKEQRGVLKALALARGESASAVMRSALEDYVDKHSAQRASQLSRGRVADLAWEAFDLLTDARRYTL